jgi:hypothetical protein
VSRVRGRHGRRARLIATAVALATTLVVATPAPSMAQTVDTSTSAPPTTTTTLPPTTTTLAPTTTTTTLAPTTTTTRPTHPSSTTTTGSSTTTTTVPTSSTSSSTPWGLIVLIVVLVVAIGLVALLLASRRKRGIETDWHRAVVPALSDAQLARASLLSGNAESDDPQVRGAVEVQVEKAATALDRTVAGAPDPEAGTMATTAANGLRGLAFAIEADRLLRHGTSPPSGLQLAQADEARRARSNELNAALARLSARISSARGGPRR